MKARTDNTAKYAKTQKNKDRRLARKLKEMERKRLKDNMSSYHYEIKDGNIIKIQGGI
jgi:citrate lyase alpha subunit